MTEHTPTITGVTERHDPITGALESQMVWYVDGTVQEFDHVGSPLGPAKPYTPSAFTVAVGVVSRPGDETRYGAVVSFDGRPTSRSCPHLHHTEKAAAKCVAATEADEQTWFGVPAVVVDTTPDWDGGRAVFEQEQDVAFPAYRGMAAGVGKQSRRFTFDD